MKYFVVKLTVLVYGYEKSVVHVVQAIDKTEAYSTALDNEAHNELLVSINGEGEYEDDIFTYQNRSITEIDKEVFDIVAKLV
tara:strand:+ start:17382 stop:17627 length:246 start_codon:yes stop_codon:yes gene_type:complete